jgi:ATP-dependent DNA helicase PIF1
MVQKRVQDNQLTANAARNEVQEFLDTRYVSAVEACWRIFELPMHSMDPTVERLPIHLKDEQQVQFDPDNDDLRQILDAEGDKADQLQGFFNLCERGWAAIDDQVVGGNHNGAPPGQPEERDGRQATRLPRVNPTQLLYHQVPEFFTWKPNQKGPPGEPGIPGHWALRKGYGNKALQQPPIGRIYYIHPSAGELYYLRMLLVNVPGPRSFDELKTVPGEDDSTTQTFETYREACQARGLLANNADLRETLNDVIRSQLPKEARNVFSYFLANGDCTDALSIWNEYRFHMMEDVIHTWKQRMGIVDRGYRLSESEVFMCESEALGMLDQAIKSQGTGKSVADFFPREMVERITTADLDALILEDRARNGSPEEMQEAANQVRLFDFDLGVTLTDDKLCRLTT